MTQAAPTQAIDRAEKLDIDTVSQTIDEALAKCSPSSLVDLPALSQAVSLAKGIRSLREALSQTIMARVFMPLQGSPLGFVTDKDKDGGYDERTVKECLIQALIMGLRPINNEFNIIGGKAYAAKNGLERLVRGWPGLSALTIDLSVPQMAGDKGAMVAVRASWLLNGKRCEYSRQQSKTEDGEIFDNRIAVRVNAGMGADAIHGKAYRKTYKGILDLLTNGALSIDDADAIETVGVAVPQAQLPEGRRMTLGEAKRAPREPGQEG
jgi:hypothetical protein